MLSSRQIAQSCTDSGVRKAALPTLHMLILGFFAGMFIALAGAASAVASAAIENPSAARLISSLVFPCGLAMVVLTGSELFTGNSLMILSVLEKKITVRSLLKNYLLVYLGNLAGSLFVALFFVCSHTPDFGGGILAQSLIDTAAMKTSLPLSDALLRAVLCNILVCIAVWMATGAQGAPGKILALYPPIVLFVLGGFEHCVANMFYIPAGLLIQAEYGLAAPGLSWGSFVFSNLLPVTLGNLIGGMLAVGCTCWFVYLSRRPANGEIKNEYFKR
ncbi:MAG: formate/nitrite transporter family protein [Eubacteriales bacterium]|nr:formate/nitrite transporter family protein [Eubacteriales bacterium]